jgi:hypothetical protein
MGKYKIVTTPNSSIEDKIKAYYNFLEAKRTEELVFYPEEGYTEVELNMYKNAWNLAFEIAKHGLAEWFPEMEVKKNG